MIEVENLTKIYRGYSHPLKRILTPLSLGYYSGDIKFKALEDLSFSVKAGETFGIVGRNGAGKSTLLKILSRVSYPDFGTIQMKGTLRSLLELGVGFNPELTGRENLYYNALMYGFSLTEIRKMEKEIFEFASLQDFAHTPLKYYSSGMAMRLGFSLATARRPDILLIDEALSVGDASFQQKSLKRIQEFKAQGSCIVLVSHDLPLLSAICDKILVLEKGKKITQDVPGKALEAYMHLIGNLVSDSAISQNEGELIRWEVKTQTGTGTPSQIFFLEQEMVVRVLLEFTIPISDLTVGFHIEDSRGIKVFGTNSHILKKFPSEASKEWTCQFQFPVRFREGKYSLSLSVHKGDNHTEGCYLWKEGYLDFEVERIDLPKFEGLVSIPVTCEWEKKRL